MKQSIMLHGILQRSGTNLLNEILLMSPSVEQPTVKVRENWFLHYSDLLYDYSERLFQNWSNPEWGGDDFSKEEFYRTIGDALVKYVAQKIPNLSEKALLSKTPSVIHLNRNFQLFPDSKVVIIVRDPRDVAASALRTWGRSSCSTVHDWNRGAKAISNFEKQVPPDSYLLLRYEDLITNQEYWVRECLQFLGLDASSFPWSDLSQLPVFGSSDGQGKWEVKDVTESFQPLNRWQFLPEDQKRSFDEVNSGAMGYFGYSEDGDGSFNLPSREERLEKEIILDRLPSKNCILSLSTRKTKLRTALRLIVESVTGYPRDNKNNTGKN